MNIAGPWPSSLRLLEQLAGASLRVAVRGYQLLLSPLLPPSCRFYPTCSEYFLEAVRIHGPGRGAWLGTKRLLKCHPFHPGGYDPIEVERHGK